LSTLPKWYRTILICLPTNIFPNYLQPYG